MGFSACSSGLCCWPLAMCCYLNGCGNAESVTGRRSTIRARPVPMHQDEMRRLLNGPLRLLMKACLAPLTRDSQVTFKEAESPLHVPKGQAGTDPEPSFSALISIR